MGICLQQESSRWWMERRSYNGNCLRYLKINYPSYEFHIKITSFYKTPDFFNFSSKSPSNEPFHVLSPSQSTLANSFSGFLSLTTHLFSALTIKLTPPLDFRAHTCEKRKKIFSGFIIYREISYIINRYELNKSFDGKWEEASEKKFRCCQRCYWGLA